MFPDQCSDDTDVTCCAEALALAAVLMIQQRHRMLVAEFLLEYQMREGLEDDSEDDSENDDGCPACEPVAGCSVV